MTLREGEVYLVTTRDQYSLIGEYAGADPDGTLVFVPGPLSPIRIPPADLVEAEPMREPAHA